MNSHAREVVALFVSRANMMALWRRLLGAFRGNPKVHTFMREHFAALVSRFSRTIEQEMGLSDMMSGTTYYDLLAAYNERFMQDRSSFIMSHVLGDEVAPRYTVTDGLPTSRFGLDHHSKGADDILNTWNMNAVRGVQAREDHQGSRRWGRNCEATDDYNPYQGRGDAHLATGVEFCDQSHLNTQQHVSQLLDNSAIVSLNRETGHVNDAVGNATPASDARLLSRRIFRTNEHGVENGVRMGDVRLHRRNFDRDIDETLRDAERDGLNRGYDMSSLYCRVSEKQAARAAYQPRCPDRYPRGNIYNNRGSNGH